MITRYFAEVCLDYFHWLVLSLLSQRKCGGYYWSFLLEMCHLTVPGNDLHWQMLVCAQLQVSVSYWCDEIISMWESHWQTYWKIREGKMLKPWDPEISEFSLGGGIQDSGSGDTDQQFFVVPAIYPLEFSKIRLPFPLSKISGVKLFDAVLSSCLELEAVAIEPPAFIVTSSNSIDETIVMDSDVEMETASSAMTIVVAEDGLSLADVTPEAKHSSDLAVISELVKLSCDAFYSDVIHSLVGVHSTNNCQLHAKWIVQSVDSALSSVGVFPSRDIDNFNYELDKSEKVITAWAAAALDGEMGTVTAPSNATHVLLAAQSADANLRTLADSSLTQLQEQILPIFLLSCQ
jgi:hypothetical protein